MPFEFDFVVHVDGSLPEEEQKKLEETISHCFHWKEELGRMRHDLCHWGPPWMRNNKLDEEREALKMALENRAAKIVAEIGPMLPLKIPDRREWLLQQENGFNELVRRFYELRSSGLKLSSIAREEVAENALGGKSSQESEDGSPTEEQKHAETIKLVAEWKQQVENMACMLVDDKIDIEDLFHQIIKAAKKMKRELENATQWLLREHGRPEWTAEWSDQWMDRQGREFDALYNKVIEFRLKYSPLLVKRRRQEC